MSKCYFEIRHNGVCVQCINIQLLLSRNIFKQIVCSHDCFLLQSDSDQGKSRHSIGTAQKSIRDEKDYIAGTETLNASVVDRDMAVMRTRIMATR